MKEMTLSNEGVKEAGDFEILASGEYDACIHGIVSLGLRPIEYQGQQKPPKIKFKVIFEMPAQKTVNSETKEEKTRVISKKYTVSSYSGSNWFKLLKTLVGSEIDSKTILKYPMSKLLGKGCVLSVGHWEKDAETTIATIDTISKLDPRLPQPQGTRENFLFSPNDPDLEVFENMLTYHTQNEIMQALDADQFPQELHSLWVKIQEEKDKENKGKTESVTGNTESIE